jgi:hypothetical protein
MTHTRTRTLLGGTAFVLVAVLAGCSSGGTEPLSEIEEAAASLTAPVGTDALAAAGLLENETLDPTGNAAVGVVVSDTTAVDRYGEYTRVRLADDAPVLTFDPEGPWGQLVRELGTQHINDTLTAGARYFVDEWVDSPARWDDSAEAWAGLNAATQTVMASSEIDMHAAATSAQSGSTTFDIGNWREGLGFRPAPYTPGVPRITVDSLTVTDMSVNRPEDNRDAVGLRVTFEMKFREPVVDATGAAFVMQQSLTLTVTGLKTRDGVIGISGNGTYSISSPLAGGMKTLPVFETPADVPKGWQTHTIDGLTFATPPGIAQDTSSEADETPAWTQFTLTPETAPDAGDAKVLYVRGAATNEADDAGGWYAVYGFQNYGLTVDGADLAAAEIGTDEYGRYRVRVYLSAEQDGKPVSYHIEWDTTPETAQGELVQYVGAMSIAASDNGTPDDN